MQAHQIPHIVGMVYASWGEGRVCLRLGEGGGKYIGVPESLTGRGNMICGDLSKRRGCCCTHDITKV